MSQSASSSSSTTSVTTTTSPSPLSSSSPSSINNHEKHPKWSKLVSTAKKAHRPYLGTNWTRDQMHSRFPSYLENLDKTNVDDYITNDGNSNHHIGNIWAGDFVDGERYVHVGSEPPPLEGQVLAVHSPSPSPSLPVESIYKASQTTPSKLQTQQQQHPQKVKATLTPKFSHLPIYLSSSGPSVLSQQQFGENYQDHAKYGSIPTVIRGIPELEQWGCVTDSENDVCALKKTSYYSKTTTSSSSSSDDASSNIVNLAVPTVGYGTSIKWHPSNLRSNNALRDRLFKCGEDDDGKTIKLKLSHYLRYMRDNTDDSPLYVFDSKFSTEDDDDVNANGALPLPSYTPPSIFGTDLLKCLGPSRRPPHKWFIMGPKRSGTTVHIDPLATSAWNTLIVGRKRWVLFPPEIKKNVVKGVGLGLFKKGDDNEAINYFLDVLPKLKAARIDTNSPSYDPNFACYEFTQNPGDTIYIPGGWWHGVLNLTDTVGVTRNFCSVYNFDSVWRRFRVGRRKSAFVWLERLVNGGKGCDEEGRGGFLGVGVGLKGRAAEVNCVDEWMPKVKGDGDDDEKSKKEKKKKEKKKEKKSRDAKIKADKLIVTTSDRAREKEREQEKANNNNNAEIEVKKPLAAAKSILDTVIAMEITPNSSDSERKKKEKKRKAEVSLSVSVSNNGGGGGDGDNSSSSMASKEAKKSKK